MQLFLIVFKLRLKEARLFVPPFLRQCYIYLYPRTNSLDYFVKYEEKMLYNANTSLDRRS